MTRRTLIMGALLGAALVGGFLLGQERQDCDGNSLDACFDRVAKTACDTIVRNGKGNTAVRQRSELGRPAPEGFGDWVFMAACGTELANVRFYDTADQPFSERPPI